MGDKTFNGNKGWESNKCNDSGNIFNKWLTDDPHAVRMKNLIARGFASVSSSLTDKTAQDVATALKKAVSLTITSDYGSLQKVLCGLMFVCDWDDALTGHACLFLSTFCDRVQDQEKEFQKYFSSSDFEAFKSVCLSLKENLKTFTHASGLPLSAVCQSNGTLYSAVWNPEAIPLYVKWLKENLDSIIESLTLMSGESKNWGPISFEGGYTAGPFLYGFVPKDNKWTDDTSRENLPPKIKSLTASLNELEKALEPSSSAGATAGGVFTGILGTGGLGAGAAYATNAFGFQNLITSFISSFLK